MIGSILKALGEAYEERDAAEDLLNAATARIEKCLAELAELGISLQEQPPEKKECGISISEYAKARGVSAARIHQLIRDQTISSSADGLIVADEADEMILATLRPGKLRNAIVDAQRKMGVNGHQGA